MLRKTAGASGITDARIAADMTSGRARLLATFIALLTIGTPIVAAGSHAPCREDRHPCDTEDDLKVCCCGHLNGVPSPPAPTAAVAFAASYGPLAAAPVTGSASSTPVMRAIGTSPVVVDRLALFHVLLI
jgi:hypothetical protein